MKKNRHYQLLDSGKGRKLERFGPYVLSRPCSQAVWNPQLSEKEWDLADATFSREQTNKWVMKRPLPLSWEIEVADICFKISPTDFGHLGIFPERLTLLGVDSEIDSSTFFHSSKAPRVESLCLFWGCDSGGSQGGRCRFANLDASKGMVSWARENAKLKDFEEAPVRWIVEDVKKFLLRERKRGSRYEGIILDPPTFGGGAKGKFLRLKKKSCLS